MPTGLFGIFRHVVLLSLPESTDRRQRIENRLAKLGATYEMDPGIKLDDPSQSAHPIGHRACAMAHQRIIKRAQAECWPSVLIFEDDCLFRDDTAERMEAIRHDVARLSWDFLYLGADVNWLQPATDDLWWVDDVYQTHAYAVRKQAYAPAIAWLDDVVVKDLYPFDGFAFPCDRLSVRPMLAIQEPGVSAIVGAWEDKRGHNFRGEGEAEEFEANCKELTSLLSNP